MNLFSAFLGVFYRRVFKPVFFKIDPEKVHDFIIKFGEFLGSYRLTRFLVGKIFAYQNSVLNQKYWGINFENPVGLAAGFDKDGKIFSLIERVGFGFGEVGTVTFGAYEGNQGTRLFRLPKSKGLVVYYGLKSAGARTVALKYKNKSANIPSIISIGWTNSKETVALNEGVEDYFNCLKVFNEAGVGEIYEINISCPNLYGGEPFDSPVNLKVLLSRLQMLKIKKPIFVKMPINLDWSQFKPLIDICLEFNVSAVVIGNLNKNRKDKNIKDQIPESVNGSVSGRPTFDLSNELISKTYKYCGSKLKIVGVGGIFSAEHAYEKICRGASLVELVTGMIYEGPQLIGEINRGLVKLLKKDGFKSVTEAVGSFSPAPSTE